MAKKLYEVIAIEGQLKTQATVTISDLRNTLSGKKHLFEAKLSTLTPLTEGAQPITMAQSDIQTSVMKELRWLADLWSKAIDTSYRVAEGNTKARADVVLDDGVVVLSNVPATAILELEKRASELQALLVTIPTLDPARGFQPDPNSAEGVYVAREVVKPKTTKVQKPLVKYEATKEHPAQVDIVSVDETTGWIKEQEWSALITPGDKSKMISRVEELRRALKAALHRANTVEIDDTTNVAKVLFKYVLGS